jgi:hypothetical protein
MTSVALSLAPTLAANAAFSKDVGLIITFIGIGVIVNVIVVLIALQIRGERQQNQALLNERQRTRQV